MNDKKVDAVKNGLNTYQDLLLQNVKYTIR